MPATEKSLEKIPKPLWEADGTDMEIFHNTPRDCDVERTALKIRANHAVLDVFQDSANVPETNPKSTSYIKTFGITNEFRLK